jgi:hypothetical protein
VFLALYDKYFIEFKQGERQENLRRFKRSFIGWGSEAKQSQKK